MDGDSLIYAILLAGGIGRRTGLNIPKQFFQIKNKPFLAYCIDKFVPIKEFDKIIVSSPKEYIHETEAIINKFFSDEDRLVVVEGGESRQDTLDNCLEYIDSIEEDKNSIIVKHAAARIFVSTDLIQQCLEYTKEYGAASPIIQSTDFIIEAENNKVINIPPRKNIVHIQTPQGFILGEYLETYTDLNDEEKKNVHDLVSLYYQRDKDVYLFEGDKSNFKITTPVDVEIAKEFLL